MRFARLSLLTLSSIILLAQPSWAAIARVAGGANHNTTGTTVSVTIDTTSCGSQCMLLCACAIEDTPTINSMTYNGTAMTAAGATYGSGNDKIRGFYLYGLTTELGNNSAVCTVSVATTKSVACIALSGANQAAPEVAADNATSTTTTASQNTITTATDNAWVVDFLKINSSTNTCTEASGESENHERQSGNHTACGYYQGPNTPTGDVSIDVTLGSSDTSYHWGFSVAPAASTRRASLVQ